MSGSPAGAGSWCFPTTIERHCNEAVVGRREAETFPGIAMRSDPSLAVRHSATATAAGLRSRACGMANTASSVPNRIVTAAMLKPT